MNESGCEVCSSAPKSRSAFANGFPLTRRGYMLYDFCVFYQFSSCVIYARSELERGAVVELCVHFKCTRYVQHIVKHFELCFVARTGKTKSTVQLSWWPIPD